MSQNRILVEVGQITNTCFVAMPFHDRFKIEYDRVIQPAIEEAGLSSILGNETYTKPTIVQDIWLLVRQARVVVADLSGQNPNVLYEVGLAHAIGKPIVFITRNEEDIPFDLRPLRYLFYDTNDPFWGDNLRISLTNRIRQAIETSTLADHLEGIRPEVELPAISSQLVKSISSDTPKTDVGGTWTTTWLSIKRQREHVATLVIPPQHGRHFSATMTVSYLRDNEQTIVHETLTGDMQEGVISLTGVNYTYLRQGKSHAYTLDSFRLTLSADGTQLTGTVILVHGTRDVVFQRLIEASPSREAAQPSGTPLS